MICGILRNVMGKLLSKGTRMDPIQVPPMGCLFMVRFVMVGNDQIDRIGFILIAMFHIMWRLFQRFCKRPYALSLYSFLLLSDRDTDRFYRQIESTNKRHDNYRIEAGVDEVSAEDENFDRETESNQVQVGERVCC